LLQKQQVGETIRGTWSEGQNHKAGTPTMGGIIYSAWRTLNTRESDLHGLGDK